MGWHGGAVVNTAASQQERPRIDPRIRNLSAWSLNKQEVKENKQTKSKGFFKGHTDF